MKNIVIICPTIRDFREIEKINAEKHFKHNYMFYGKNPRENMYLFDPIRFIDNFTRDYKDKDVDGIIGTHDYPGALIASILSEKMGTSGTGIIPNLICQHKYYSRIYQEKVVPDAVPDYNLIDPFEDNDNLTLEFPIFIRPVKSFFSIFASRIDNTIQYGEFIESSKKHIKGFSKPINKLLEKYSCFEVNADYLIAEELLTGRQVTLEGYSFEGEVKILGITDSIMYPGTISFKRFEYPSSLDPAVQERMACIASRFIASIGFDTGIFNMEFFYDPRDDSIKIIEANPRMASQFADMIEKVEGLNTYEIQIDLSLGKKPGCVKDSGKFKYATSFVLRSFEDRMVKRVPSKNEIRKVLELFPEARIEIYGEEGKRLSSQLQDMQSYRYGIINLGGNSRDEQNEKFGRCMELLKFGFVE